VGVKGPPPRNTFPRPFLITFNFPPPPLRHLTFFFLSPNPPVLVFQPPPGSPAFPYSLSFFSILGLICEMPKRFFYHYHYAKCRPRFFSLSKFLMLKTRSSLTFKLMDRCSLLRAQNFPLRFPPTTHPAFPPHEPASSTSLHCSPLLHCSCSHSLFSL